MARYLFAVWPFSGHLHPALAIAHALRGRGHEVAFYSGSAVRSAVEDEGFRFFPFQRVDEERTTELATSGFPGGASLWSKLRNARKIQASFREWLLDSVPQQVEDIDAISARWRPDYILCDLAFWGPFLILHELRQIPVAVLSITAACILPGPDAPPWGPGLRRPQNFLGRTISLGAQRALGHFSKAFRSDVNALRRRYDLPPLRVSVTEFAAQMPLYLVPSSPEYDYGRRDLPPSVHYVGPCLWDKPSGEPRAAWLSKRSPERPLIYVTEATIGTTTPFLLEAAAAGLKDLPVDVVMTTGRQRNPEEVRLPAGAQNVRVEAYVPQSDLLPDASVMVTLGGSGGVLAALQSGTPLVVVPTEWDRPENAQRVVEAGAGIRISASRCTPKRIRQAVLRVLTDSQYRANANRMAAGFSRYQGAARAAELLEDLVAYRTDGQRKEVV